MRIWRASVLFLAGLALLLNTLLAHTAAPDTPKSAENKATPVPGLAEVRFANGSIVMMTLLQESIEIMTEYGKLTVPHKDIRQIDFGVRSSEEERRKIDDAMRRLSGNAFKEREDAVRDLIVLGPPAYLRLQSLPATEDPEVAKRIQTVIAQIREKYHPRLLRLREDDIVRTAKFTIVGRITTPTIKASAEEFGELDLRPAKLLAIRGLAGESEKEVVIDAATYGNQGSRKWLDTGIQVSPHLGLKITAAGQVDLWPDQPGQYMSGPDGQGGGARAAMMVGARPLRGGVGGVGGVGGELLARIGEDGTPFVVGSRFARTPKETGKLYLQIVPSPWGNSSTGEYRVTIAAGPFANGSDKDE